MKAMKVSRGRTGSHDPEDSLKKAAKLDPVKKNGKEKHYLYREDDENPEELYTLKKQKSTLDYYDDGGDHDNDRDEEDEEWDEDEDEDENEDE